MSQTSESLATFLMERAAEKREAAEFYERQGFNRAKVDEAAERYEEAALRLVQNEVKLAQASDTLGRLAIYAGLAKDPSCLRHRTYFADGEAFNANLGSLRPRREPLVYRLRTKAWELMLAASMILRAYG